MIEMFRRNFFSIFKLPRNFLWNISGIACSRGATLLIGVYLAQIISPSEFGLYNSLMLFGSMFVSVVGGSLSLAVTHSLSQVQVKEQRNLLEVGVIGISLFVGIFIFILLFFLTPIIAEFFLRGSESKLLIITIASYAAISVAYSSISGIFFAREKFKSVAIAYMAGAFMLINSIILFSKNLDMTMLAQNISISTSLLILIILFLKSFLRAGETKDRKQQSLSYSPRISRLFVNFCKTLLPLLFSSMVVSPAYWGVSVILSHINNNSNDVALYGVSLQWFLVSILLPTALSNVKFPKLVSAWSEGKRIEVKDLVKKGMKKNLWIMSTFLVFVIITAPKITKIYRFSQSEAPIVFSIFIIAATIAGVQIPLSNLLLAARYLWLGLAMNVIWGIILLGGTYLLRFLGPLAPAIALLVAYLCQGLLTLLFTSKLLAQSEPVTAAGGIDK